MKRRIAVGLLALALAAGCYKPGDITNTNIPDGQCHEDDACWDCSTMGNHICGPDQPCSAGFPEQCPNPACYEKNKHESGQVYFFFPNDSHDENHAGTHRVKISLCD